MEEIFEVLAMLELVLVIKRVVPRSMELQYRFFVSEWGILHAHATRVRPKCACKVLYSVPAV
jgi:hypothetical protein